MGTQPQDTEPYLAPDAELDVQCAKNVRPPQIEAEQMESTSPSPDTDDEVQAEGSSPHMSSSSNEASDASDDPDYLPTAQQRRKNA